MVYLAGRMNKSAESIRTEKDIAELITRITDYEELNLVRDEEGTPILSFESEAPNDFLKNQIVIKELKEEAGNTDIPEKFFNEIVQVIKFTLWDVHARRQHDNAIQGLSI